MAVSANNSNNIKDVRGHLVNPSTNVLHTYMYYHLNLTLACVDYYQYI